MDQITIRPAVPGDEEALARVHVAAWQTAYRGILPDAFLENLSVATRVERWRERLAHPGEGEFSFAAEARGENGQPVIVGFASGGPERDGVVGSDGHRYDGEVYAIYLLAEWRRRGVGRKLIVTATQRLIDAGFQSVAIYVLRDNANARRFYEALGGVPIGEKPITIGQTDLMETIYGWPDARKLLVAAARESGERRMKLTRYDNAAEFLNHARGPLEEEEAVNGLIVGIAARVAERPDYYGKHPIYFATVDEGDRLIAAAGRTPPHRVIIYSALGADPEPLRLIVDDLVEVGKDFEEESPVRRVSGVTGPSATALAFAQAWTERAGQAFKPGMNLRLYELREVYAPDNTQGHMRPARDDELDLLTEWVYWFNVDCHLPAVNKDEAREIATRLLTSGAIFFWEADGAPVSMAGRGRNSSHGITVSMVYTPPELRGRGYASACVAALSQQLLDNGWQFCALYTDLANPTSNSIYQRIGYRPVCDSNEYDFITE